MAKLKDNFYNRVIEGELDAEEEISSGAVKAVESAQDGTIDKALGLDSNGKLVKGSVSGGITIENIAVSQLEVDASTGARVIFRELDETAINKIRNAKMIIFTMNNSFVLTPLATNSIKDSNAVPTRSVGSFAYDTLGNTAVVKVGITVSPLFGTCSVKFDTEFQSAVETSGIRPNGALLVVL